MKVMNNNTEEEQLDKLKQEYYYLDSSQETYETQIRLLMKEMNKCQKRQREIMQEMFKVKSISATD